jgi:hypothetical protein
MGLPLQLSFLISSVVPLHQSLDHLTSLTTTSMQASMTHHLTEAEQYQEVCGLAWGLKMLMVDG